MIIPDKVVEGLRRLSNRELTTGYPSDPGQAYESGLSDGCAMLAQEILKTLQEEPTGDKANA